MPQDAPSAAPSPRLRLRALLAGEGPAAQAVNVAILGATLGSAVLLSLDTVEGFSEAHGGWLWPAEVALSVVFLVEYLARLWSDEKPLRYAFSFWGIVDLAASLPVLLLLGGNNTNLRALRLLRLARLMKLLRIGAAQDRIVAAFRSVGPELGVFFIFAAVLIFFAAAGIYVFEHDRQPEAFGSIPESLWWAVITLTTVGYGDVYPVTPGGKVFTGLLLLVALSIVAIPTGLFSAALMASKRRGANDD